MLSEKVIKMKIKKFKKLNRKEGSSVTEISFAEAEAERRLRD